MSDDQTPDAMPDPDKPLAAPDKVNLPAVRPLGSLQAKSQYAEHLAGGTLLPAAYRGKPANLLFAIEYAEMLGLSPMVAITQIHVIEGKPTASAALISALVRRAGHKLRVTWDAQAKVATAQIIRADDPDFTFTATFSLQDAQAAGLHTKEVWRKYPGSMCKARAITQVSRDACEEALMGAHYTPEELGATNVDEDGAIIGGTVVGLDPDAIMAEIKQAVDLADPVQAKDALIALGNRHGQQALQETWPCTLPNGDKKNADEALRLAIGFVERKVADLAQAAKGDAGERPATDGERTEQQEPQPDEHPQPDADGIVDAVIVEPSAAEQREATQAAAQPDEAQVAAREKAEAAAPAEQPTGKDKALKPWLDEIKMQSEILGVSIDDHGAPLLAQRGVQTVREVPVNMVKLWTAAQRPTVIDALRQAGSEAAAVAYAAVPAAMPATKKAVFDPTPAPPLG